MRVRAPASQADLAYPAPRGSSLSDLDEHATFPSAPMMSRWPSSGPPRPSNASVQAGGVDEDLRDLWVRGELGRSGLQQRDMVLELLRSRLCREAGIALGSAAGVAAGCVVDVEGAGDRAAYDEGEKECKVDPE